MNVDADFARCIRRGAAVNLVEPAIATGMLTRDEARRIAGNAKLPKQPHGVTLTAVPDSNCRATGVLVAP